MTAVSTILIIGVCLLAYSNGSNDNFKGVATLFGSNTTDYKNALAWATITTFAGSITSILIAQTLVVHFSGKGLVPGEVAESMLFLQAVVFGAGLCVWVATLTGLPISTTHSLVGALVGAGFMAAETDLNVTKLGSVFIIPLLTSPLIATVLTATLYTTFKKIRAGFGWQEETCICIEQVSTVAVAGDSSAALTTTAGIDNFQIRASECRAHEDPTRFGIHLKKVLNVTHFISAGGVCFARGLNDTPKIVAAIIAAKAADLENGLLLVALFMAAGGIIQAKKVAETMSKKITPLNEGQGLSANLVTFFLVVFASRMGVPVSTTHVSVGSLFGIGLATQNADTRAITGIVIAWVATLPIAALLAASSYAVLGLI